MYHGSINNQGADCGFHKKGGKDKHHCLQQDAKLGK